MPAPTLGCQIAPHYFYHGDGSSSNSESDVSERVLASSETATSQGRRTVDRYETTDSTMFPPSRPRTLQRDSTHNNHRQVPVGFWHWSMAGVRLHVLKLWLRTNLILALAIMTFLCLFWGALFDQDKRVKELNIWIVDFDGQPPYTNITPFVGPFVTKTIRNIINDGGMVPGYAFVSPRDFGNDPLKVRESVYDFKAWAAIIINPGATAILEAAVGQGNASYDPLDACEITLNTARDQTTFASYILPGMNLFQKRAMTEFGPSWIAHLLENSVSVNDMHLEVSPQAISPGIDFTVHDLRPFGPPIATPAVSIGLIYLIIISFFSFTFFLPIHLKYLSPKGHPPLHFHQLIVWRYTATVASYFLLSLVYSFVSLAFLLPLNRSPTAHYQSAENPNAYGYGTFVVYWMGNWVGMTAFGLASENMAMLLGTPWTALWLIFWVISNVATGFYALELAPDFYRWGYAWPMHNIVELTRSTLFDLHPRVGLNFGILFAWVVIDTGLFPLCCYYMRWNTARMKNKAIKADTEWKAKMDKANEDPGLLARITTIGSRR